MLVLTRSVGERLIINDGEIKLSVLEVKGSQVRLGIDAPRDVSVHREEVFDRIRAEIQKEAANLVLQEGTVEVVATESQQDSMEMVDQPVATEETTKE
jgi:carbon storage regulator